ncbi:unnamed protein product, partial [Adineta steineri]
KHKQIPSVYGILVFKNQQLSYSGSTYIVVRSGKHDYSTAFTYLTSLFKYLSLNKFKECSHTDNSEIKLIFIVFTDGGPDQKPRFPKTQ